MREIIHEILTQSVHSFIRTAAQRRNVFEAAWLLAFPICQGWKKNHDF